MLAYIVRRLALMVIVVAGVMSIIFVLQKLAGDPTLILLPVDANAEARATLRSQLGLDRPVWEQYLVFLGHVATGNLGHSWKFNQPAAGVVLEALPRTLLLAGLALLFGIVTAIPLGIVAAIHRGRWIDTLATFIATVGQAIPVYWLGLLLIMVFGARLRWLPTIGGEGVAALILPTITLGVLTMARIARITRSSMLEVMGQDFIRTVRAKGMNEATVLFKHGLRNAMVPIAVMIGLQLGTLLGGAVIVETVFSYPGVGRLAVNAVYARDFPMVQAVVLVVTVSFSLVNTLVDIVCAALNPQIRLS
jgi:peptide/nickel transport system permease protein